MRVLPSLAEPDLVHLILTRKEREELRKALKGTRGIARELRRLLKVSAEQKPHKWRCWPWKHVWHEAGSEDYWDEHANYRDRPIQRCANCRAWRWTPGG